jgi:hypothetical protein
MEGSWRMEDGGRKMVDGESGRKMEDGEPGRKMEDGRWKMEDGRWKMGARRHVLFRGWAE